ncbi:MAG: hypothetical protein LBO05_00455 [Deltaproteobacteria bacterium]|jgi:cytochrome c-type biogenesis protein CcmH/NrfF|nr:hypothetical protein [Deltaproteobacteria bacterium]
MISKYVYAVAAITIVILVFLFINIRKENQYLKYQQLIDKTVITGLSEGLKQNNEALKQRQIESEELNNRYNELHSELESLYDSQENIDWSNTSIPDSIYMRLRD